MPYQFITPIYLSLNINHIASQFPPEPFLYFFSTAAHATLWATCSWDSDGSRLFFVDLYCSHA